MENITVTDSRRQTHVKGPSKDNPDLFFFDHKNTVLNVLNNVRVN